MKSNNKSLSINLIAIVVASVFLTICNGDDYSVSAASSVKKDAHVASYTYNPAGKPDPFHPFVNTDLVVKKPLEKATPSSIFPLQKLSLDQFDLVGIAGDEKQRLAIMETKENKGRFYPIILGTVIGLNKGKVIEIQNDRIIVEEVTQSKKGPKSNRITIKLHHINEEESP